MPECAESQLKVNIPANRCVRLDSLNSFKPLRGRGVGDMDCIYWDDEHNILNLIELTKEEIYSSKESHEVDKNLIWKAISTLFALNALWNNTNKGLEFIREVNERFNDCATVLNARPPETSIRIVYIIKTDNDDRKAQYSSLRNYLQYRLSGIFEMFDAKFEGAFVIDDKSAGTIGLNVERLY